MSSKRPRTPSVLSSLSASSEPSSKAVRTSPPSDASSVVQPLLCSLPPTCNPPNRPTALADTKELELHYAKYHAHVCEEPGCRCVFPDERLMELHQTECHDPIAALRKERGEKIFACHLASCDRLFSAPKARRLHLIQAHGYPKEYFFAVTNKGIGGLLKKWGEGASMIRGEWKPRESHEDTDEENDKEAELEDKPTMDTPDVQRNTLRKTATGPATTSAADKSTTATAGSWMAHAPLVEEDSDGDGSPATGESREDALAGALSSLFLVPATVRFGRGASKGGFAHGASVAHQRATSRGSNNGMDVDGDKPSVADPLGSSGRGRGRGGRGNARAQGRPPVQPDRGAVAAATDAEVVPPRATRPPMPPRGLGRGARGRFPGRARILFNAGRGRGM